MSRAVCQICDTTPATGLFGNLACDYGFLIDFMAMEVETDWSEVQKFCKTPSTWLSIKSFSANDYWMNLPVILSQLPHLTRLSLDANCFPNSGPNQLFSCLARQPFRLHLTELHFSLHWYARESDWDLLLSSTVFPSLSVLKYNMDHYGNFPDSYSLISASTRRPALYIRVKMGLPDDVRGYLGGVTYILQRGCLLERSVLWDARAQSRNTETALAVLKELDRRVGCLGSCVE